jgi:methylphosphotriester-DNA--protein-cysteine methyltransferase
MTHSGPPERLSWSSSKRGSRGVSGGNGRFKQQVGLPPKTAARLARFGQVWRRLATHPPARWDELAADSGYADQAHLIRDFRQFTGASPAAFLAHPQAQTAVPPPA